MPKHKGLLVGYCRVSTQKQGASGLGIEAQTTAIRNYVDVSGGTLVSLYTEVETGKGNAKNRPELAKALAHAKRLGATVVFAKLDRLSRNAAFLLGIIESGADVVFCDCPTIPTGAMGKFFLTQMAAVAELERGLASERTKAALAAYKARGGKLGTNNLTAAGRAKGGAASAQNNRERAALAYADLLPLMRGWRTGGLSLAQIAGRLNEQGHTTQTGCRWAPTQVMRCLA